MHVYDFKNENYEIKMNNNKKKCLYVNYCTTIMENKCMWDLGRTWQKLTYLKVKCLICTHLKLSFYLAKALS